MESQNRFAIICTSRPSHLCSVYKRRVDNFLVLTTPIKINKKKRSIQTTLLNHDICRAEVSMHPPISVHFFQESLKIFLEIGICGARENFWVVVNGDQHSPLRRHPWQPCKSHLEDIVRREVWEHVLSRRNILAILMGEFDTQLSTSSSGVEITKENKVVFGCQLKRYLKVCVVEPEVKDVG